MHPLPFLSTAELTNSYRKRVEELSADRNNLLPEGARQDADQIFKKKKLVICGSISLSEIRVLAKHGDVFAIVDDFAAVAGKRIFGIPVIHSDHWIRWAKKDKNIVSCIMVPRGAGYQHFVRQCIQWDIPYLDPLQTLHLIRLHKIDTLGALGRFFWYGYEFFEYALQNHEKLLKLMSHLEDEFLRYSWISMLMYRMTMNPYYLETCAVGRHEGYYGLNSYAMCKQFIKLSDSEVYLDAGAFVGDTIESFLTAVNGKFKHIYSFEPSTQNNQEIRNRLARLQASYLNDFGGKISLIEKGLWDRDTVLKFNPARGGDILPASAYVVDSKILENIYDADTEKKSVIEIPVTTIDKATNCDSTFIKFEIEGSELQALHGAAKTIERNRPQMAISIYHKPDDYVTLTEFVLNTKLDYRLGFRQHSPYICDTTVLYCYR
jgi:FkbM family methyltransferase